MQTNLNLDGGFQFDASRTNVSDKGELMQRKTIERTKETEKKYHRLFTFGYTDSKPEILRAFVKDLDAKLVDIRFSPRSRAARWNKAQLQQLVGGDNYEHLQALGNENYKGDGPIKLLDPEAGIGRLLALLAAQNVIILCGCKDYHTCHRNTVAGLVAEYQIEVKHL